MSDITLLDAILALTRAVEANTAALTAARAAAAPASPQPAAVPSVSGTVEAPRVSTPAAEGGIEAVVAVAKAYAEAHGVEALKQKLKAFGATTVSKLPPDKLPEFLRSLQESQ